MNIIDKRHPLDTEIDKWADNEYSDTSFTDNYDKDEDWDADYITGDHSDYNRSDSRFYWNDYDF